jgi:hypothetical protein
MANADSATNMLWLINQATAGQLSTGQVALAAQQLEQKKDLRKDPFGTTGPTGTTASFSDIKIDMTT